MDNTLLNTIAQFTLDCEARRDRRGRLTVYLLHTGDGGGLFEVAGICERYDHDVAWHLRGLVNQGSHAQAELAYYLENTNAVRDWCAVPVLRAFLRVTASHRGVTGCARIVQMALGMAVDGALGPVSRRTLKEAATARPGELLTALRTACEQYERPRPSVHAPSSGRGW